MISFLEQSAWLMFLILANALLLLIIFMMVVHTCRVIADLFPPKHGRAMSSKELAAAAQEYIDKGKKAKDE